MAKKPSKGKVIKAVAYCRKSTNEETAEKSIQDQQARILRLKPMEDGAVYEIVKWYTNDKGVPGWKRGAKRPDYFKLVNELPETGAKAILVDDMDRFSRADPMETNSDVQKLRELGVRYIHAVNQRSKDLVEGGAIVSMQIAMEANASHEFSTRLSRRIAESSAKSAADGKRPGGSAPYGMANDGSGGLKSGDPKHIKVVRQIFKLFLDECRSLNGIVHELNSKGIPSPRNKEWTVPGVKQILTQKAYRGDFVWNQKKSGQFHTVNEKHQVVPVYQYEDNERQPWKLTPEGVFVKEGLYVPLIDPKVFDAAQKRLASIGKTRKPRTNGYPLTGILICDHCGKAMAGRHPTGRDYRVYNCQDRNKTCKTYEVREDRILPHVLKLMGEEIVNIKKLLTSPPDELRWPRKKQLDQREQLTKERDELARKVTQAEENLLFVTDPESRQSMDKIVSGLRAKLRQLNEELDSESSPNAGYSRDELKALTEWYDEFYAKAISVPLPLKKLEKESPWLLLGHLDPMGEVEYDDAREAQRVLVDPSVLNDMLHGLGCEVRLRFEHKVITTSNGKTVDRYPLQRGRFRLGQLEGTIKSGQSGVSFCKAPPAGLNKTFLSKVDRVFSGTELSQVPEAAAKQASPVVNSRQPSVSVEYDAYGKRVTKQFPCADQARRFYAKKAKEGKQPKMF